MEYYIKSFVSLRTLASWLWYPRASELFLHSSQHFQATFSCGLNSSTTKNTQHRWCYNSFCANVQSKSRQNKLRRGNTSQVRIVSANENSSILTCFEQLWCLNVWKEKCWCTLALKQKVNAFVDNKFETRSWGYSRSNKDKNYACLPRIFPRCIATWKPFSGLNLLYKQTGMGFCIDSLLFFTNYCIYWWYLANCNHL